MLSCGGQSRSASDAGADTTDDASRAAPYAGTWEATRSDCPNGIYSELRNATWSILLTDAAYTDVFSVSGCQATNSSIPFNAQGNHATIDLSSGTQSCDPSPCQGGYSSTDTGSPTGVSYGILVCPKQLSGGYLVDIAWSGNALDYAVAGASCVQHFARRL